MANTVVISRTHLIYGICLPLAVLLGYLLAEPFELGSKAMMAIVFGILCIPLLLRWHHPFLIFATNASIFLYFLPSRPVIWMPAAAISFFLLMLNRAMGQDVRFFRARNVSLSLIFIGMVVLVTAYLNGGIGFAMFGAKNAGGKKYITIFLAIMLYFGLSTIPINRKYATLAVATYFLSTFTILFAYLPAYGGPAFNFLVELFPIENALAETAQSGTDFIGNGIMRLGQLTVFSTGLFCFLMASYGARRVLDTTRPWRLGLLLVVLVANLYSGYRSSAIVLFITFFTVFYFEGLVRTRYFAALLVAICLGGALLIPFAQKLPLPVQRTLCFLPINVDPMVRASADGSTDWRLDMWQEVLPTVPQYLIRGKGFVMDYEDSFIIEQAVRSGFAKSYEGAMLAGDYHSGPLSVIIPFGLFGVAGFIWFLAASIKALRRNYDFGDESLKRINCFLLAYFVARLIGFIFVFGSFYADLFVFASLIGLSVSLNSGVAGMSKPLPEPELE